MVAALSGIAFLFMAFAQLYAPSIVRILDMPLTAFVSPFQTYEVVQASLLVTALGDVAGVVAIALGSAFFMRHHQRYVLMLAISLMGTTLVANTVKVLVSRTRPEMLLWLDPFLSFSFPSGHATATMALFGFLAVAASRLIAAGSLRTLAVGASILVIVLVGASRILLGAHFLSDVIGGWLLGLTFVALVFSIRHRERGRA